METSLPSRPDAPAPGPPGPAPGPGQAEFIYYRAFEFAADVVMSIDEKGTIVYCNDRITPMTGYLREEVIGRPTLMLLHPDEVPKALVSMELMRARGYLYGNEYRVVRKDGSIVNVSVDSCAIRDESGLYYRTIVIVRDVTEQKRSLAALRESQSRYNSLFAANHAVMFLIDPADGRIVDCNDAACAFYGWGREAMTSMKITEINTLPPEEVFGEMALARAEKRRHFYFRHRLAGGEIRNVEVFSGPIMVDGRQILYSIIHDVTDAARSAEAIKASEEKYKALVEQMPLLVCRFKTDGTLTFVNSVCCNYIGLTAEELVGTTFMPLIYEEDRETVRRAVGLLCRERPTVTYEHRVALASGEVRWQRWTGRAILDGEGRIVECQAVGEDVTQRRRAEEEKAALEERLRQSQKMEAIGHLAGGIAHDFNNLLTGILGYADVLRHSLGEDDSRRRYAETIVNASERAASLTGKLLAFARKGKYQDIPVDIHRVLSDVEALLLHGAGKGIRIVRKLSAASYVVIGDPGQVENVLLNLAVNARDAMPLGGTLTFATRSADLDARFCALHGRDIEPGRYVEIAVGDTGVGMDKETLSHIFEPFFTTKGVGCGTGLGLASVYGTVKSHRGAIEVESERGKGSTFRIYLPLAAGEAAEARPAGQAPVEGRGTVMVVDDDEMSGKVAADILGALGYVAVAFGDAEGAVRYYMAHSAEVDLVLLDLLMPGMGGRQACLALQRVRPGVRVILVSGMAPNREVDGLLSGQVTFMQKPYRLADLSAKVAAALAPPLHGQSCPDAGRQEGAR